MSRKINRRVFVVLVIAGLFLTQFCFVVTPSSADETTKDVFTAENTSRESLRVVKRATVESVNPKYEEISGDTKDLSFQTTDDGREYLVFVTNDATIDDQGSDLCKNSSFDHVYWVDKLSKEPAVCVSSSPEFNASSQKPLVGGPEDEDDAGRYVIFESFGTNVAGCAVFEENGLTIAKDDKGDERIFCDGVKRQIFVHDRKWEKTALSQSITDACRCPSKLGDNILSMLSDNGQYILFSSNGGIDDSLDPKCYRQANKFYQSPVDADPTHDELYQYDYITHVRDGGHCQDNRFGPCQTEITRDRMDLHAAKNVVEFTGFQTPYIRVNEDYSADSDKKIKAFSDHDLNREIIPIPRIAGTLYPEPRAFMPQSREVIVFDTFDVVPTHFLPDTYGYEDIFIWIKNEERFERITNAAAQSPDQAGIISSKNFGLPALGHSRNPRISDLESSNRYVVFESEALDLILTGEELDKYKETNGKWQIYRYDRTLKTTEMISVVPSGDAANANSFNPWISRNGRFVIFESYATDLVEGVTTTPVRNIFMRDTASNKTYIVSTGHNESSLNVRADVKGFDADAYITFVSGGGLRIAFQTRASNVNDYVQDENYTRETNPLPKDLPEFTTEKETRLSALSADATATQVAEALVLTSSELVSADQDVFITKTDMTDSDGDGTPNIIDFCPLDPLKGEEGQCGCGNLETDSDIDGTSDCNDVCPTDPNRDKDAGICGCNGGDDLLDSDDDLTPDCLDGCPTDPNKTAPGLCGCGALESDDNGNRIPDCADPDMDVPPAAPTVRKVGLKKPPKYRITASSYSRVSYRYTLTWTRNGKRKSKVIKSNRAQVIVENLKPARYRVTYKIKAGTETTVSSRPTTFTVRKR